MREIIMDTETTGLDPDQGHRIVEIGALELINHIPTGRTFHQYINPGIAMPAEAIAIHGISDSDLADKPAFEDVAQSFIEFIAGGTLVIHNAPFDIKFLNAELQRVDLSMLELGDAIDTLQIARTRFPGAQNSLDGLCRRFGIDNTKRVKHGALLDSEILADIYLELLGGRQSRLEMKNEDLVDSAGPKEKYRALARTNRRPVLITEAERERHTAFIRELGEDSIWAKVRANHG